MGTILEDVFLGLRPNACFYIIGIVASFLKGGRKYGNYT